MQILSHMKCFQKKIEILRYKESSFCKRRVNDIIFWLILFQIICSISRKNITFKLKIDLIKQLKENIEFLRSLQKKLSIISLDRYIKKILQKCKKWKVKFLLYNMQFLQKKNLTKSIVNEKNINKFVKSCLFSFILKLKLKLTYISIY